MRFELEQDDALLRDSVRDLGRQRLGPQATEIDEAGHVPPSVVTTLGEMGLLGLRVPEAEGGAGLSMVATAAVLEELGAAHASVATLVATHNLQCVAMLEETDKPQVRDRVLPQLISGQHLGTWALGEPGLGPDASGLRMTAERAGEQWVLRGEKPMVVAGMTASHALVVATGDPQVEGQLVVLLVDLDDDTIEKTPVEPLGLRGSGMADLRFEGTRVPASRLVDHHGGATREHVLCRLDEMRIGLAAVAVGIGRAAITAARDYALEREQFGRPIAQFQAIQWKLANAATELDAARLLTWKAAAARDAGQNARALAAQAKLFATGAASRACSEALQIHGGYGYTREFSVERCLRDARQIALAEGTSALGRFLVAEDIERRFCAVGA